MKSILLVFILGLILALTSPKRQECPMYEYHGDCKKLVKIIKPFDRKSQLTINKEWKEFCQMKPWLPENSHKTYPKISFRTYAVIAQQYCTTYATIDRECKLVPACKQKKAVHIEKPVNDEDKVISFQHQTPVKARQEEKPAKKVYPKEADQMDCFKYKFDGKCPKLCSFYNKDFPLQDQRDFYKGCSDWCNQEPWLSANEDLTIPELPDVNFGVAEGEYCDDRRKSDSTFKDCHFERHCHERKTKLLYTFTGECNLICEFYQNKLKPGPEKNRFKHSCKSWCMKSPSTGINSRTSMPNFPRVYYNVAANAYCIANSWDKGCQLL